MSTRLSLSLQTVARGKLPLWEQNWNRIVVVTETKNYHVVIKLMESVHKTIGLVQMNLYNLSGSN